MEDGITSTQSGLIICNLLLNTEIHSSLSHHMLLPPCSSNSSFQRLSLDLPFLLSSLISHLSSCDLASPFLPIHPPPAAPSAERSPQSPFPDNSSQPPPVSRHQCPRRSHRTWVFNSKPNPTNTEKLLHDESISCYQHEISNK